MTNIILKSRQSGRRIPKSKIPVSELNQIIQTKSSPETIVALLNQRENYHFNLPRISRHGYKCLIWRMCLYCKNPFLIFGYEISITKRRNIGTFCSISCRQKVNIRKYLLKSGKGSHPMKEERKKILSKLWK